MSKALPWLALLVAALLGWRVVASHLRDDGAVRQQIADITAQRDARSKVIAALVSRARPVDTVPVVKWFAKWDTLYDTLDLSDTAKTRRLILTADSTIKSCKELKLDCVAQVANRDSTIGQLAADTVDLSRQVKLLEKQGHGLRFLGIPLGCTVGGVASSKGVQPGVGCGVRF